MRQFTITMLILLLACVPCFGIEVERQRGVATFVQFPLVDSTTPTLLKTGAANLDSEYETWSDGTGPSGGYVDLTNEAVEIGTDGQYTISVTAGEMTADYISIQIKSDDAMTQTILIRTMNADPLLKATTTAGTLITVAGGGVYAYDHVGAQLATGADISGLNNLSADDVRAAAGIYDFTLEAGSSDTNLWIGSFDLGIVNDDALIGSRIVMTTGLYTGWVSTIQYSTEENGGAAGYWTIWPSLPGTPGDTDQGILIPWSEEMTTSEIRSGLATTSQLNTRASQTSVDNLNNISAADVQAEAEDAIEKLLGVTTMGVTTGSSTTLLKVDTLTGGPGWYSPTSTDIFNGGYIFGIAQSNSGVITRIIDSSYSGGTWTFLVHPALRDTPQDLDTFRFVPAWTPDTTMAQLIVEMGDALSDIDLDKLTANSTGIPVGGDLSGAINSGSVFGHVMSSTAGTNMSSYNASLYSLEAHDTTMQGRTVSPTAAGNIEDTYDGSGYTDPVAPARQNQLDNIALTGAAINQTASSFTKTVGGTEVNDYTFTVARDGIYHQTPDVAGVIDVYYEFNIGGDGVPTTVTNIGNLLGGPAYTATMTGYAYNWDTTNWDVLGTTLEVGVNQDTSNTFTLFTSHVGTGVDIGKVQLRMYGTGLDSGASLLSIDQLFVSYAVVNRTVGYANGMVWIDTVNGTAGTELYINGTADNPVLTWAEAQSIATGMGLNAFHVNQASVITLSGAITGYSFSGLDYMLDLSDEQVDNVTVMGAVVMGTATGNGGSILFEKCKFGDVTLPEVAIIGSAFAGTITLNEAGTYFFEDCASAIAGTGAPIIDFGVAVDSVNLNMRHYSGGIDIRNMGQAGTDTMSLEGWGQIIMNANCVGGTIALRGHFAMTDNTDGSVVLSDDANFKSMVIHAGTAQSSTANTITLSTRASVVDGAYDPSEIMIVAGAGAGQTRMIYEYAGATRIAVVDRNWKVEPDTTSEYRVLANPGREHVNEGLAQGGSTTSITLNTLASDFDDAYNSQTVFLRSGQGEDQSALIVDYDGTSKVATIEGVWPDGTPNATTGYVMLPSHVHPLATIQATNEAALAAYDGPTDTEMLAAHTTTDALIGSSHTATDALINGLTDFDPSTTPVELLLSGGTAGINATELVDLVHDEVIEGGITSRELKRIMAAALAGDLSIAGGVYTYTGLDGSTIRIEGPVTATGRSTTTIDGN